MARIVRLHGLRPAAFVAATRKRYGSPSFSRRTVATRLVERPSWTVVQARPEREY